VRKALISETKNNYLCLKKVYTFCLEYLFYLMARLAAMNSSILS